MQVSEQEWIKNGPSEQKGRCLNALPVYAWCEYISQERTLLQTPKKVNKGARTLSFSWGASCDFFFFFFYSVISHSGVIQTGVFNLVRQWEKLKGAMHYILIEQHLRGQGSNGPFEIN